MFDHKEEFTNPAETSGARSKFDEKPSEQKTARANQPETAGSCSIQHQNTTRPQNMTEIPPEGAGDQSKKGMNPNADETDRTNPAQPGMRASGPEKPSSTSPASEVPPTGGEVFADHNPLENQLNREREDLRFSDPTVAQIVQLHRMRRRWMKAKNALILQGKAFGRAVCDGDKEAGSAAFERVMKGKAKPEDADLEMALVPFIASIEQFDQTIKPVEKQLEKLAKKLPIAPWAKDVKGLGWGSIAAIVGEAGDLSKYPSVSGVWKRMGLAVINGDGRQRKCANAEQALAHGYSPERRSVVWNMADSMSKHQRTWFDKETGEVRKPADEYGIVLEQEKAKALEKGLTKLHAENIGKRHMSKAVLKDMTLEWRRAVGHSGQENHTGAADRPQFLEAAE